MPSRRVKKRGHRLRYRSAATSLRLFVTHPSRLSSQSLKNPWSQSQSPQPVRRCRHLRDLALPSLSVAWALHFIFLCSSPLFRALRGRHTRFDDHSCLSVLSKAQTTRASEGSGERFIPPGRMPQGRLVPDRLRRCSRRQPAPSSPLTSSLRGQPCRRAPVAGGVSSAGAGCGRGLRDPGASWVPMTCVGEVPLARRAGTKDGRSDEGAQTVRRAGTSTSGAVPGGQHERPIRSPLPPTSALGPTCLTQPSETDVVSIRGPHGCNPDHSVATPWPALSLPCPSLAA